MSNKITGGKAVLGKITLFGVGQVLTTAISSGSLSAQTVNTISTVTVPGAQVGDFVIATPTAPLTNLAIRGIVPATSQAAIMLLNPTSSAQVFDNGAWRIKVFR